MQHLDEGTIHAWLDGALGAAESGAVEAHVAVCRACADRVAEARGFIAASSRILLALDDVPAEVVPAREPAVAAAAAPRPMVAAAAPPPNAAGPRTAGAGDGAPVSRWGHRYGRLAAVIAVVVAGTLVVARESERDAPRAPAAPAPAAERSDSTRAASVSAAPAAAPRGASRQAPKAAAPPPAALGGTAGTVARESASSKRAAAPQPARASDSLVRSPPSAAAAPPNVVDAANAVQASSTRAEARALDLPTVEAQAKQLAGARPRLLATDTLALATPVLRETYAVGADTVVLVSTPLDTLHKDQLRAARSAVAERDSSHTQAIHWVGRDGTSYTLAGRVSIQALEQIRVALGRK